MKFKIIYEISWALMTARLKQTLVAAVGVTFSITMFITLLSFMGGLNQMLDNLILNRTPHIRLYNEVLPSKLQPIDQSLTYRENYNMIRSIKPKSEQLQIHNSLAIIDALKDDDRVLGNSPKMIVNVFYNVGGIGLSGMVNGINVSEESRLFTFEDYVIEGNAMDLKNTPNSIILGVGAAENMLAKVGDVIQISTIAGNTFPLKVVGLFQSGIQDLDKVQSYSSIGTAQKIMGKSNDYVTDIQIKLKDLTLAPSMAKEYARKFGSQAVDIQTANSQFDTGSSIRSLISYVVGITLLIVAGFGIYNILNMMIYEKMDTIAILKATGFSGKDVNRVFMTIALTIGVLGGLAGLIFGFGLSLAISYVPFETAALPTISTYPIFFNPVFYLIGAIFSIITTYLAGYFPSKKASKIDPVDIIRGK
jgi:lipoprotein-releasing system permease protein